MNERTVRPLRNIAGEIRHNWQNVNYAAKPYLEAMAQLDSIDVPYGQDDARDIVARFLGNSRSWTGETARRIKAELKSML